MFHVKHFSYFISVIPYLVHAFFHFPPYMEKSKNSINVSRETLMEPTTRYGYQAFYFSGSFEGVPAFLG